MRAEQWMHLHHHVTSKFFFNATSSVAPKTSSTGDDAAVRRRATMKEDGAFAAMIRSTCPRRLRGGGRCCLFYYLLSSCFSSALVAAARRRTELTFAIDAIINHGSSARLFRFSPSWSSAALVARTAGWIVRRHFSPINNYPSSPIHHHPSSPLYINIGFAPSTTTTNNDYYHCRRYHCITRKGFRNKHSEGLKSFPLRMAREVRDRGLSPEPQRFVSSAGRTSFGVKTNSGTTPPRSVCK